MRVWRVRILLTIIAVHLIAIPLFVYQFLQHFEKPAWETEQALARSLAVQIRDQLAIRQMAFGQNQRQLEKTIQELCQQYGLANLRVYDRQGRLRGWQGTPEPKKVQVENKPLLRLQVTENFLYITNYVGNEVACHSCHDPQQKVIGVIQASIPVADFHEKLQWERKRAAFATFIVLLLVFTLVFLFHYVFMVNPIGQMLRALARIREGDLSVQIPLKRKDEMGRIAESINKVVESLRDARAELEKRHQREMVRAEQLATVGEIAAGLAHEVKNPLAGITSALEVLLEEGQLADSDREILTQILGENRRIADIVNDLLLYARPRIPQPDWCDVGMLLSDVQRIFAPQCHKYQIVFTIDVRSDPGRILVDGQELKQVLMNVLRNALEALSTGGEIRLLVDVAGDHVLFAVQDNGQGMTESVRSRIFQPFFTTKPEGTGLGLAIVQRMIQEMKGSIRVDSHPGKGTRFEILIPREPLHEVTDH